jgi:hypothetical protein
MRQPIKDEHLVRASLQRCLESSVVVPTMFWTEAPNIPGAPYKPIPRCEGHALGIHGRDANIGGNKSGLGHTAAVVDLTRPPTNEWGPRHTSHACAVLPFSDKLWLFQDRTDPTICNADEPNQREQSSLNKGARGFAPEETVLSTARAALDIRFANEINQRAALDIVVLLPDGKPVTLRAARRYAQSTPQYAAWQANPQLATPWCTAPTLQLLTSTLRPKPA